MMFGDSDTQVSELRPSGASCFLLCVVPSFERFHYRVVFQLLKLRGIDTLSVETTLS